MFHHILHHYSMSFVSQMRCIQAPKRSVRQIGIVIPPLILYLVLCFLVHSINAYQLPSENLVESQLHRYGEFKMTIADGLRTTPVYLFKRGNDSELFAVKQYIDIQLVESDKRYLQDIENEFRVGKSLKHPSIVETLDIIRSNHSWSIVLEYCPRTLAQMVRSQEKALSLDEASCIFRQLLDGLSFMHAEGVVHHDLKLTNVMVGLDGKIRIIDFGTAYHFRGPLDHKIRKRHGMYEESSATPR